MTINNVPHKPALAGELPLHAVKTPLESPTLPAPDDAATSLPISPPATDLGDSSPQPLSPAARHLYQRIVQRYQGVGSNKTWERVRISPQGYQKLRDELWKDTRLGAWIEDKLRYDYDSAEGEFVLRMPSILHEHFLKNLELAIVQKLRNLVTQEEVRPIIEGIRVVGSPDVHFSDATKHDKKSPDSTFYFNNSKLPLLVIEVANSQKRRDLSRLAESYIERTKGCTKTVITIDLEYRAPTKRANPLLPPRTPVYSIYRNRVVRNEETGKRQREAHAEIEDHPFLIKGSAADDGSLCLLLSDFCPDGILSATNACTINISHAELSRLFTEAEDHEHAVEAPPSPTPPSPTSSEEIPFVSKRKRTPTPEITPEHEEVFQQAEIAEDKRQSAENSSFSLTDVENTTAPRTKRIKTRSQRDLSSSP
jgi:hypothetical protein